MPGKELEEKLSERATFDPRMATWNRTSDVLNCQVHLLHGDGKQKADENTGTRNDQGA